MCSLLSVYQLIEVLCCLLTLISLSMIFEGEGIQLKELSPGILNKEYPLCQIKVLDFNQKHQTFRCQQLKNDFTFTTFSLSGAMCFTNWQGDAQILLRRIEGKPCHALIPHYTFEGKLDGSNYFFVILHELEDSRLMIMMSASQQRIQLRAIEVHVSYINICLPSNLVL